jgi:NTE family protein
MAYHFKNLVFEGGGVKGIAYAGALEVLDEKGVLPDIKRVGGTSAGAINAALLGLGYGADDVKEILWKLDFNSFLDDSWGVIRDTDRLIHDFGWYKGGFFREWIGKLIEDRAGNQNATFRDLQVMKEECGFRDLYFVGTNVSTGFAEVFSYEHTPRTCIADAVRISMSIPLFFAAKRSPRGDVYVDGGMLDNYPVKLFDRRKYVEEHATEPGYYEAHNKSLSGQGIEVSEYVYNQETLGFRLDSEKEIAVFRDHAEPPSREIDDFFSYAWGLVQTLLNAQESRHLHSDDWHRTIYIDTLGVKTTEFDLNDERKEELVSSGRAHTEGYFQWFDGDASQPANQP